MMMDMAQPAAATHLDGQGLGGNVALVGIIARHAGSRCSRTGQQTLRIAGEVNVTIDVLVLRGEDFGFARTMLGLGTTQFILLIGILQRKRCLLIRQPFRIDFRRRGCGSGHCVTQTVARRAACGCRSRCRC